MQICSESNLAIPLSLLAVRSVLESISIVLFSKLRIALIEAISVLLETAFGSTSAALSGVAFPY